MSDRATFGDELRWLRKKADISQIEMAAAIGVTQPTYSRWESGEAEPRASDLRRIIEVLEIPPATFFRFLGFEIAADARSVGEWIEHRRQVEPGRNTPAAPASESGQKSVRPGGHRTVRGQPISSDPVPRDDTHRYNVLTSEHPFHIPLRHGSADTHKSVAVIGS